MIVFLLSSATFSLDVLLNCTPESHEVSDMNQLKESEGETSEQVFLYFVDAVSVPCPVTSMNYL